MVSKAILVKRPLMIASDMMAIMSLAIINGLLTSIALETIILMRQQFNFQQALKTALGMSFISMISMEVAMNITDVLLTGGAMLTWWVVPIMLFVGFITPWPRSDKSHKKHNRDNPPSEHCPSC